MSRRFIDVFSRLNRKSFAVVLVMLGCVLYLSYTLNTCIIRNLGRVYQQHFSWDILPSTNPVALSERSREKGEVAVKVVPLDWAGVRDISNLHFRNRSFDLVSAEPKYRFLRQQGLQPSRKLPDALIIGVKKGGTRALLEFIRLHPDVRAAGSEIHFFDRFYDKGFQWYRQCMPPTLEGQLTMEKTPSYFITREVPERVYQMNPLIKLVVVVRDPVTRAISDYTQVSSKRPGMPRFEDLAFLNGTDGAMVDTSWGPLKIGIYARHLERWLQFFPLSQFLLVSGERLIVDPATEMARVQDFLGLKKVITEKHFYFNSTKGFPCLMKSEGRSSPHCLGKTKGRNHPLINSSAIERLREFYRPFNIHFYRLAGIDFGWP